MGADWWNLSACRVDFTGFKKTIVQNGWFRIKYINEFIVAESDE